MSEVEARKFQDQQVATFQRTPKPFRVDLKYGSWGRKIPLHILRSQPHIRRHLQMKYTETDVECSIRRPLWARRARPAALLRARTVSCTLRTHPGCRCRLQE